MKKVWYGFFMCVILAWVSFIPFHMYKENQLNMRFIKAERLIKLGQEHYDARKLDDALFYLHLAAEEYPNYYYPYLLKGNWLWESGYQLDAVLAYHQALRHSENIALAYERIIDFYQSEGMEVESTRYQLIYDDIMKSNNIASGNEIAN